MCGGDPGQNTEPKPPTAFSETTELAQDSGNEPKDHQIDDSASKQYGWGDGSLSEHLQSSTEAIIGFRAYQVSVIIIDIDQPRQIHSGRFEWQFTSQR